ncbi:hypothetical protein NQZ68_010883 [Dissostichus eleginoides]|nr:hypothetical protein NQZ68_010883 [Dissostichus eleginoides]
MLGTGPGPPVDHSRTESTRFQLPKRRVFRSLNAVKFSSSPAARRASNTLTDTHISYCPPGVSNSPHPAPCLPPPPWHHPGSSDI